jgi:membrane protein DedA with SNARE-associated domain
VEDFLLSLVAGANGLGAYLIVFTILVICGLGVPLPEDFSLILGGFLAHSGDASLPVMMAVGFVGILVGDSLIFYAGRRIGTRVGRKQGGFFARIVTPEKRAKVEGLFAKHGQKVVMIARFAPGVRAVTYFTAGSAGMSYWRFIFWDGVAALASAPAFVWLGYYFGGQREVLRAKLEDGQFVVLGSLAVLGLVYFLYRRRKSAQARALAEQAELTAPATPLELAGDATGSEAAPAKLFEGTAGSARAELRK